MLDTNSSGSRPLRHDAETFRVAEELIMLSSRAASSTAVKPDDSPSNISGFFEHTSRRVPKVKVKKGRSERGHRMPTAERKQAKSKARSPRGAAHKSSDRGDVKQEPASVASTQSAQDIINSRCDTSHSELLKEHRVRFRRVRRRWNIEQRTKKQEYLARFHVQGIPLVQHLEALTHWRPVELNILSERHACLPHVAAPRRNKGNPGERSSLSTERDRRLKRQGRGNTRHSARHRAQRQQAEAKDTTALEIAANEALFGQTGGGADEPWALGLPSTSSSSGGGATWGATDATWFGTNPIQATAASGTGDFFARGGNQNPTRSGKSGGNSVRKAKGGGDSLPLASADAPSMGNYDRDAHLRMPMPHRVTGQQQVPQVAATHHLPHRMKNAAPSSTSNSAASSAPYFHHLLDRNSNNTSSTNSLLFNQTSNFADSVPVSTNTPGKRPRSSNSNSNSNNASSSCFLTPFGFPSPLPFDTEHPLPDFNTNWGFSSRNVPRSSSSTSSALPSSTSTMTTNSHSTSNVTTTTSLSGIGSGFSSPNGASMFAGVDSFLPDYDSTLYSLWNTPSAGAVLGYETENDAAQSQQQQVHPPLYMASDDELKMDYPQLPEFNQDLDSYLNDAMESGGPSPTTPLGTSTANSAMKMDHLVTTDRRTGAGGAGGGANLTTGSSREPQLERLLLPTTASATADYLVKRERGLTGLDSTSARSTKRSRGAFEDTYAATPASGSSVAGSTPSSSAISYRGLSKNPTIEPKRAVMPSLGSYHSGQSLPMPTHASTSETDVVSTGTETSTTPTTMITSTSTPSEEGGSKSVKRPRSRQCEFPGCQNRARSHQKCKKHGGAHQCVFEGCTKNSQSRGLCIAHGGGSRCKKEGCVRAAQSKGLCKSHGGGEYCAVEGCNKKAHLKHLCRTHGGGVRCKFEKCSKWAQRKGWCMAHAKEYAET
ncbi:hypothetical protein PHYPSEUDO_003569 [Phytophthora pseudosyringae]|uniref:WRKY19-like zinc finger domain-containing protein n=1 Tax=Phytophthora pseudosyringae TaxID=221518 RepID=A0A8T1VQ90_9STRA|nr:hypothetical protein PHYPSEUDO_003569 [Phytophthora pseudosyringae]